MFNFVFDSTSRSFLGENMLYETLTSLLGENAEYKYDTKYNRIAIYDSQMYECPELQFHTLVELSELFGSEEITTDMDYIVRRGCETCDYGSDYGYELIIANPTKNVEEYKEFAKLI